MFLCLSLGSFFSFAQGVRSDGSSQQIGIWVADDGFPKTIIDTGHYDLRFHIINEDLTLPFTKSISVYISVNGGPAHLIVSDILADPAILPGDSLAIEVDDHAFPKSLFLSGGITYDIIVWPMSVDLPPVSPFLISEVQYVETIAPIFTNPQDVFANNGLVNIFPNPSSGNFLLLTHIPESMEVDLRVYDPSGKLVINESIPAGPGELRIPLSLEDRPNGLYLYQIRQNTQFISGHVLKIE